MKPNCKLIDARHKTIKKGCNKHWIYLAMIQVNVWPKYFIPLL